MPDTTSKGKLLLADDEMSFLKSTGDLLRDEGYECCCVPDGRAAAEALRLDKYDLLIADIKMPGNPDLELIRKVKDLDDGLPVILVTGYPSMRTAIDSVSLPVVAYVLKPIDFPALLTAIESALSRSRVFKAVCKTQQRLLDWDRDLDEIKSVLSEKPAGLPAVPTDTYVALTLSHIAGGLADLRTAMAAIADSAGKGEICRLLDCPRTRKLVDTMKETIDVLEKSKRSFRSKELSDLRKKIEDLVDATD
jgi:DNA-binding response OmpR family regulator